MGDKFGGKCPGPSKPTSPSSSVGNPNESSVDLFAFHSHFSRASDRMLQLIDKLDDKINKNAVDIAEFVKEDRARILDLERKMKSIEDWQDKMTRGRIPTAAQQEPAIPPQDPGPVNPPPNPPSVSAPAGRARRACDICGKDLSVPYDFKHQKQQHPDPK